MNGKRHGLGEMKYDGESVYRGYWKNNLPSGKGVLCYLFDKDVERYCGNFKNGEIEGYGTLFYANGRKVIGKFENGELRGSALLEDELSGLHFGNANEKIFTNELTK